ncbi:hypothetical protein Lal_00029267 [Lupinus albus]|nr:hypothetical protein Lal_00029267 [Lupinus albus]
MNMNTASGSGSSTSFRIIISLVVIGFLLQTICYVYHNPTEPRRPSWVSHVRALIMFCGFYLLVQGIILIVDLFLNLSQDLLLPTQNTDIDLHNYGTLQLHVSP